MKKMLIAATALMMTTGTAMADPAAGLWRSENSEDTGRFMHVRVAPCGAEICGVIQDVYESNGTVVANHEIKGKTMIWAMKPQGNGAYAGGKIWAADTEKTYKSKMQLLSASQMKVEGCIIGICRGQTWSRVQ